MRSDRVTHHTSTIAPSARLGVGTTIGFYSVIGVAEDREPPVEIGEQCKIGNHVTIEPGVKIGNKVMVNDHSHIGRLSLVNDNVLVDANARIGSSVSVGNETLILYGAQIYDHVRIGCGCRIGGFVAENATIGKHVTTFGKLIHSFRDPTRWSGGEATPHIEDFVVVGFDALVIGGVAVGHHVYIAAGAIVSKDVPPHSIVVGVNEITPFRDWRGRVTRSSFWNWRG